jgi:DNA-binding IclR family transcriptional regulator
MERGRKSLAMAAKRRESVGSAEKAFRVLGAFTSQAPLLGLDDLSRATGLNRSAVQRVTYTLVHLGYLRKEKPGLYALTHKVLRLSYAHMRFNMLMQVAAPYVSGLADQLGMRADLAVLDDTEVVYLIRIPSRIEMFSISPMGRRWTAISSASGRVMLSRLEDGAVADVIARAALPQATPSTILDRQRIRAIIAQARNDGYTYQLGEVLPGAAAIAAPVIGASGMPIGAISLGTTVTEMQVDARREELARRVMETANLLSQMNITQS